MIRVAKNLTAVGVLLFGISAAGALVFRFFATEGARFYIEALRLKSKDISRAQESLNKRYRKILICRWSKGIAAVTLALAHSTGKDGAPAAETDSGVMYFDSVAALIRLHVLFPAEVK